MKMHIFISFRFIHDQKWERKPHQMTSIRYLETVHGTIVWTISLVCERAVFLLKIFTLKCSESTWQRSLKNRFHPFRCVNFFSDFSWQNTSVCVVRFLLAWIPYSWPHHTRITIIQFIWMQTLALHIAIPQSSAKLRYKWPAQTSIWFLNSKTSKRDTKMN